MSAWSIAMVGSFVLPALGHLQFWSQLGCAAGQERSLCGAGGRNSSNRTQRCPPNPASLQHCQLLLCAAVLIQSPVRCATV
eukprot:2516608-Amphidinium_carterae.1